MTDDIITIPGRWDISYDYAAGRTASEFLRRLRDEKRISGVRCAKCGRVILPPRGFCERCFVAVEEWVDVAPSGVIEAFTITTEPFDGLPDPPCAIAYVRLDGASTAMLNFVRGVDLVSVAAAAARMAIGTRVRVEWKEAREGRITDFYYVLA
ncbi:MAG: Zn-ribbon domain-containing OB-fold protein [Bryobacteraceae bacterium]